MCKNTSPFFFLNTRTLKKVKELAYSLCPVNRGMRCSHVAFLVKKNKVVHIGWNKPKTHPKVLDYNYHDGEVYLHAELDVCLKAGLDNLGGYELVVLRIDRTNKMTISKPCKGCQHFLAQLNLKNIYFSQNDGTITKL